MVRITRHIIPTGAGAAHAGHGAIVMAMPIDGSSRSTTSTIRRTTRVRRAMSKQASRSAPQQEVERIERPTLVAEAEDEKRARAIEPRWVPADEHGPTSAVGIWSATDAGANPLERVGGSEPERRDLLAIDQDELAGDAQEVGWERGPLTVFHLVPRGPSTRR